MTFTLGFDEAFMSKRFLFWPTKFSSTHHGFSQAAYVSAFESMLVAVVLTAENEVDQHRGKLLAAASAVGFFLLFSRNSKNQNNPICKTNDHFQKVDLQKRSNAKVGFTETHIIIHVEKNISYLIIKMYTKKHM